MNLVKSRLDKSRATREEQFMNISNVSNTSKDDVSNLDKSSEVNFTQSLNINIIPLTLPV